MKLATRIFIVATIGIIAAYDLFAIARAGVPASISAAMLAVGTAHPVLPFTWGGLSAHLFWGRARPLAGTGWTVVETVCAAAAVIACLVDLLHVTATTASPVPAIVALLAGLVVGHVVFAQEAAP